MIYTRQDGFPSVFHTTPRFLHPPSESFGSLRIDEQGLPSVVVKQYLLHMLEAGPGLEAQFENFT